MLPHKRGPNGKDLDMRLVAGKEVDGIQPIYLQPKNSKVTPSMLKKHGEKIGPDGKDVRVDYNTKAPNLLAGMRKMRTYVSI